MRPCPVRRGCAASRPRRRSARQPLPRSAGFEPIWSKFAWGVAAKFVRALRLLLWIHRTSRQIQKDPNCHLYKDQALNPVCDDETERLELFTHSHAARRAVEHAHKTAHLTGTHSGTRVDVHA